MIIGYARIASSSGNIDKQINALKQADCEKIFEDIGSGIRLDRSGYTKMMMELSPGDTLIVYSIDRLSRKPIEVMEIVKQLVCNEITFISLQEKINTATGENTVCP